MELNATGWLSDVLQVKSPHYSERVDELAVDLIVVHCCSLPEGSYGTPYVDKLFTGVLSQEKCAEFKVNDVKVSAHFFITRLGEVRQYVSVYKKAWHAGRSVFQGRENCNDYSIGIELEGTDRSKFEQVQYMKLNELIRVLKKHFPDITYDRIVGHSAIAPDRKTDPGEGFDWSLLKQLLEEQA